MKKEAYYANIPPPSVGVDSLCQSLLVTIQHSLVECKDHLL